MKSLVKVLLCLAAFSPLSMNAQFCGSPCGGCDEYYFSVWGGGNVPFNNHPDLDTGWYVGGAIGTRFSPCMRADISFDYLRNQIDFGGNDDSSSNRDDENKYVLLVNGYYDFSSCGCFVPYIGAGIGYGYINTSFDDHDHINAFAFQVGAGVTYEINDCWAATASYRLLGTAACEHVGYHNLFGVGLTRRF